MWSTLHHIWTGRLKIRSSNFFEFLSKFIFIQHSFGFTLLMSFRVASPLSAFAILVSCKNPFFLPSRKTGLSQHYMLKRSICTLFPFKNTLLWHSSISPWTLADLDDISAQGWELWSQNQQRYQLSHKHLPFQLKENSKFANCHCLHFPVSTVHAFPIDPLSLATPTGNAISPPSL